MKWLDRLRRSILGEPAPPERPVFHIEEPPPQPRRTRVWTGEGSQTEFEMLYHLQFGPLTRRQLDEVLDVSTAGIHAPLLIDRHLVEVVKGSWPFRYVLTEKGRERLSDINSRSVIPKKWLPYREDA